MLGSAIELGRKNAGKYHPRREEDVNMKLPFFKVSKNEFGKYKVENFNHKGHDNEPRMDYVTLYLSNQIFPNIDKEVDITGYYNIELHDSFSYLNNSDIVDYENVLTFGGIKNDKRGILIPDTFMMGNWGNQLQMLNDQIPWTNKTNKIVWVGTTTGDRDPIKNERIKTCLWALNKKNFCDFYITKIAQMTIEDIMMKIPNFNDIFRSPIGIPEQMAYRYHLTMDGNASPWNVFEYFTNSLVFKQKSDNILWYSPLFKDRENVVDVDLNNLEQAYYFYGNNPQEANMIIQNMNKFARDVFRPLTAQQYTVTLFETMGNNR